MTSQIDLSLGGDRRDAIHQMVECLVEGGIARLHTETSDDLLALATHTGGSRRLASLGTNHRSALMVGSVEAMADFIPTLSRHVFRLFHRSETPIHLAFAGEIDDQILQQLPDESARLVRPQGELRFAVPVSDVTRALLRLLPGPVTVMGLEETPEEGLVDLEVRVDSTSRTGLRTLVRFHGDTWTLAEPGELSEEDISRMMAERIVFVCTGNTCRSPMAEGMLRKLLAERLACAPEALPGHGFEIVSAGVSATSGAPASPESVAICADHGVDLRTHASQPLQLPLLESSDRLYTMTAGHRDAILYRFPEYAQRVQLLSRDGRDVIDPIGAGQAAYEQCFSEITENLQALVNELTAEK